MRARLLCPERRVHFCSVAVCSSVLKCVAACCNVLQCVIVCCSVLQCESRHTRESCHTQTPHTWVMSHTNESRHTRESCRMSSGMRNRLYEDTTHMRRLFNRYHKTCRLVQPVELSPHMRSLYMQQSAHMGSLLMQQSSYEETMTYYGASYSAFRGRRDSVSSSKCRFKSWMVGRF